MMIAHINRREIINKENNRRNCGINSTGRQALDIPHSIELQVLKKFATLNMNVCLYSLACILFQMGHVFYRTMVVSLAKFILFFVTFFLLFRCLIFHPPPCLVTPICKTYCECNEASHGGIKKYLLSQIQASNTEHWALNIEHPTLNI